MLDDPVAFDAGCGFLLGFGFFWALLWKWDLSRDRTYEQVRSSATLQVWLTTAIFLGGLLFGSTKHPSAPAVICGAILGNVLGFVHFRVVGERILARWRRRR